MPRTNPLKGEGGRRNLEAGINQDITVKPQQQGAVRGQRRTPAQRHSGGLKEAHAAETVGPGGLLMDARPAPSI